ncbi:MAG: sugar phosphate isomerase/epimerase [Verrucomicrobiales bacterium]|nr:sugar phosphate isomerase/epimerase [Verrucomicrobiales bacterium]
MKIGFNLLLWTTHFVEDQFSLLGKLKTTGYDGVEIPIFDTSDPAHFKKIGQALKDNGLQATAVTVCPDEAHNPISPDAANRQGGLDHLKKVIDCGQNAGIQLLCGPYYQVLGQFSGAYPTQAELERAAEVHRALADHAQQAGITLAIESLNRFEAHLLNTIAQAKAYVKLVNHPNFGTMFDTFHANIEEKNPLGALQDGYDVVRHVHISENDRGTPGKGHNPIAEVLAFLKGKNFAGWTTIEAFGGFLPDLAAATRVWRDFFPNVEEVYEEGFGYIKKCLA